LKHCWFVLATLAAIAAPQDVLAQAAVARIGWLSAGTADIDAGLAEGLTVPRAVLARADQVIQ
jgi:hypothetical protein